MFRFRPHSAMYPIPDDFDISIFTSRTLEMVCFAQFSVTLHFNDNLFLTVEGKFEHQRAMGQLSGPVAMNSPMFESGLRSLLGRNVSKTDALDDGTLQLTFVTGDILNIFGDNGPYESYHIHSGKRVITV
jgi:hypothetical protein